MSDERANCPTCAGVGKVYFQINDDHRMQLACPACGGSGARTDAMYRILTGDAELASDVNNHRVKLIRITHGEISEHTLE